MQIKKFGLSTLDFGKNVGGLRGPDEWLRIAIVNVDVLLNW